MRTPLRLGVAMLGVAVTACVSGTSGVEVRPIGIDRSRADRSAGGALAEAQAQLALGNVGLALEEFRKALRGEPASVDSLVGIARCYDAMGRTDLSRRYFEEALALAPGNVRTLGAFALSLEGQGRTAEALAVRQEIASRSQAPASSVSWRIEDQPAPLPSQAAAASVTVDLPPAEAAPVPAPPAPRQTATETRAEPRVRLERLSLGEVALVTTPRPYWHPVTARAASTTPAARPERVRLLNAARRQGLAARSRDRLADIGWRSIVIGDASRIRSRSIVYYPLGSRPAAQRLATNLRIEAIAPMLRTDMLVLLGRDVGG